MANCRIKTIKGDQFNSWSLFCVGDYCDTDVLNKK